jgi:hypothetical protein
MREAVGSRTGLEAEEVLKKKLGEMGKFIEKNPDLLYNNVRGKPTRYIGMRDYYTSTPAIRRRRR